MNIRPLGWAASISCSLLALATAAQAQTASQIAPPTFAPPVVNDKGMIRLPDSVSAVAPAGSDAVFVQVREVAIDGNAPADAAARMRERLIGKRVTIAEVFAAAAELEAEIARDGRVLTRVIVPAQTLEDAESGAALRLRVVEGFIERIDTAALPKRVRSRAEALLASLVGRKDVTLAEIERSLALASDIPGLTLSSTIAAGTQFGGTVLVIEGRHRPVTGFLTFDNLLADDLGRTSFGLGIDFNSVLGMGETIYLRASGLPNTGNGTSVLDPTPRNRALAAGVVLPLGNDGLSLTTEYTDARLAPRHAAALPGIASRFERLSLRLQYPLLRSRGFTLGTDLGLDVQRERVRIFDPATLPLSEDRQRVLRGGVDLFVRLPGGGYTVASVKGSFGLDIFNARSAADANPLLPLSRAGSDASFEKLEFAVDIGQPLAQNLSFDLKARAQLGLGQAMSNAEQFGIATLSGISPLPAGSIQGDSGYVVRGELRAPFALGKPGIIQLSPYVFGAHGGVRLEQPTALERRRTDASAYGIGARLALPRGITASAEYGRAHIERVRGTADRITFSLIAQF